MNVLTNTEYHNHQAVSKSDLDLISRSPLHFKFAKELPKAQTPNMLLGSLVHKLVLEPNDFDNEYIVAPDCDRRTRQGKEIWNDFIESAVGMNVITEELKSKAESIANSVLKDTVAACLLRNGEAEQSFFWVDDETGIECKCRPDYLKSNGIVIDLKTTSNASPESFVKSAYDYRYYVQAWWYLHGLHQCKIKADDFIFIAVETEPPYAVCIYAADDLMLELGERKAKEDLRVYAECLENGQWYGYSKEPDIRSLSLPDWVIRKEF